MGCGQTKAPSGLPTDQVQQNVVDIRTRPARTGIYFVVHRDTLSSVEYLGEPVDIANEFFSHFAALDESIKAQVKEYFAVELDNELIRKQRSLIRISSYRWSGVVCAGEESGPAFRIPTNFRWFLSWIKERQQIGWIDFVANIGVNVPVPEVIAYMGELYADSIVLGEWQLGLASLREAEKRGWIHQEMAYGALDSGATLRLFAELRELGERCKDVERRVFELRSEGSGGGQELSALLSEGREALAAYWQGVGPLARLLAARGYAASLPDSSKLRIFDDPDEGGGRFEGVSDEDYESLFTSSLGNMVCDVSFAHSEGLFRSTADRYAELSPLLQDQLNRSQLAALNSPTDFQGRFAVSILTAYLSRELTFEQDRDAACTTVARAVAARLGEQLDAAGLLRACWAQLWAQLESSDGAFTCDVKAPSEPRAVAWGDGGSEGTGDEAGAREGGGSGQAGGGGEGAGAMEGSGEPLAVEVGSLLLHVRKRYGSEKEVEASPYASMAAFGWGLRLEADCIRSSSDVCVVIARCEPELHVAGSPVEPPGYLQVLALLEAASLRVCALHLIHPEDTPRSSRSVSPSGEST